MNIKEQAKKNLLDFKQVADELKIPFFLQAGTLLGAYRDKDFVKGDESDCDLGILECYYKRIHELMITLKAIGFKVSYIFRFENAIESVKFERGQNHLDVLSIHIRGSRAFNLGRSFGSHGLPSIFAYTFSSACFIIFEKLKFLGTEFDVPYPTEMYLNDKYRDWRVPVSREKYDYLDVKQAPCINNTDW